MIISLTGFMGCGKSSVGRILPTLLDLPEGPFSFIDLDDFIISQEGMSVNEIFSKKGESGFRRIETSCLNTVIDQYKDSNLVLALGGGTILLNSETIRERTVCIYLSASVETLQARLKEDSSRPLLKGGKLAATIEELYSRRESTYRETAAFVIRTDGLSVPEVAGQIKSLLSK